MKSFDMKSFSYTIVLGLVLNVIFLLLTGNSYEDPFLPILGMLSLFMITGALIGIKSQDITIIEPGLGSILVSLILFILLPILKLETFENISESDWIIVMMNNVIMTFVGAWLGEKLHAGYYGNEMHFGVSSNANEQNDTNNSANNSTNNLSWGWVMAGTVLGLILSMIVVNIFGLILNVSIMLLFILTGIAFVVTGLAIGRLSPGVTIREAGIAGFLVMTIDLNIFRATHEEIPITYLIGSLIGAFILTYIGGHFGEKMQTANDKKVLDTKIIETKK